MAAGGSSTRSSATTVVSCRLGSAILLSAAQSAPQVTLEDRTSFEHQAVPEFAHNPQIRKVADGYALFMIGGWQMELCHCKHPLDSTQCKLGGPVVRNR